MGQVDFLTQVYAFPLNHINLGMNEQMQGKGKKPGSGGTCLYSQHTRSRGRRIFEFEDSKFQDHHGYAEEL